MADNHLKAYQKLLQLVYLGNNMCCHLDVCSELDYECEFVQSDRGCLAPKMDYMWCLSKACPLVTFDPATHLFRSGESDLSLLIRIWRRKTGMVDLDSTKWVAVWRGSVGLSSFALDC